LVGVFILFALIKKLIKKIKSKNRMQIEPKNDLITEEKEDSQELVIETIEKIDEDDVEKSEDSKIINETIEKDESIEIRWYLSW
jgi:hypothetical protein